MGKDLNGNYPISRCVFAVCRIVLPMRRIDQCNQHIDIEQIPCRCNSSSSCFTNSGVTALAANHMGNSGTPFRTRSDGE